ncbi:MAG: PhoH family protein [Deferribacterota bacterium]|nr:PhoH family protein [Deferribacterota bacterium]
MCKKNFVIDTNVVLYSPDCLETFKDNNVFIPAVVLEELDKFKNTFDMKGYHAREFIRKLELIRKNGNLLEGVGLKTGGTLYVKFYNGTNDMPNEFCNSINDNFILGVAQDIKNNSDNETILISKDVNLRIKANVIGIKAEDYYHDKSNKTFELNNDILLTEDYIIDHLYKDDCMQAKDMIILNNLERIISNNDYFLIRSIDNEKKSALVKFIRNGENEYFEVIKTNPSIFGVVPINYKQRFLVDALLNPNINIVFAIGIAGTGKTLLSISAALTAIFKKEFKKLVITRSPVPMGRDLGYLPGKILEKMDPWLKPIYDNLELLIDQINDSKNPVIKDDNLLKKHMNEITMEYLNALGIIEIEALTYIRGRTFHDTFLIIDEAQNLTPHEVKTIITRAGNNTKIVLTGDPFQIDNPYLDERDNGLVYASEKFKNMESTIAASIYLSKCERSLLAEQAAEFL